MKLAFVWFTYRNDALPLLESVRSVRSIYPEAQLVIMDDAHAPMRSKVHQVLQKLGAVVAYTQAPRLGALRGWKCAQEIARTFAWVRKVTGADLVVKTDPDTVWLAPGWLEAVYASPCAFGGMASRCGRGVQGFGYALKPEAIDTLNKSYDCDMESPYLTEEDFELSVRLLRANGMQAANYMLQVVTSHCGMSPACPAAVAGFYDWAQDMPVWRGLMRKAWQVVTMAATPDGPVRRMQAMRKLRTGR